MATILTKKSDTASAVPLAADLTNAAGGAELAVNATDKRLFSKTSGGTVVELGINPSSLTMPNGTANGVAYLNGSKVVTSGSALTFSGQQFAISSLGDQIKISNSVGNQLLTLSSNSAGSVFTSHDGTNFVPILWQSNTAELMRLTSTGLGIGTSSPTAFGSGYTTLTISGSNAGIFQSKNTSGDTRLYADTSGQALLGSWANTSLLLYTNSTLKATLDSSGNLGLGVTPSAWDSAFKAFQLNTTACISATSNRTFLGQNWYDAASGGKFIGTGYALRYDQLGSNGQHQWYTSTASGTAGNAITFTQAMTLDASGNLNIGNTGINSNFRLNLTSPSGNGGVVFVPATDGSAVPVLRMLNAAVSTNVAEIGTASGTSLYFGTGGTERARIDSSGNLLIGSTSSATFAKTYIEQSQNYLGAYVLATNASYTNGVFEASCSRDTTNSSYNFIQCAVAGVAYRFYVRDSGNVQNTNNSYGAISDIKLKENIVDASPKLADLMQVKVRQYNFKNDQTHKQIGVIAQELEEVFPAMIEESPDRDMEGNDLGTTTKAVKYSVFVPMLIKAIQEQQVIIESLTQRIATLEAK